MTGAEPPRPWRVVVTDKAAADLRAILDRTARAFGTAQRLRYRSAIAETLRALRDGPDIVGSRPLDRAVLGLRRLAVRGLRSPHLLIFREGPQRSVVVLRVLQGAMDLTRHLPSEDDG